MYSAADAVLPEIIAFSEDKIVLDRGSCATLLLDVEPGNASLDGIVYYSFDTSVAQIDQKARCLLSEAETPLFARQHLAEQPLSAD